MPGLLCRFTQDALDAQLKPLFYKLVPPGLLGPWLPDEEAQMFVNGSKVYLRALKSSEEKSRYAKFIGLTLGFVAVDQAEEVPEDYWDVLKGRSSLPPFQRLLSANPPNKAHWLAREFPDPEDETPTPEGHRLIRVSLDDNAENLRPEYIAQITREYPPGHPLHARFILGRRGPTERGNAVYKGVFEPARHVVECVIDPKYPLLEAWDFGFNHPAVLWAQWFPGGRFRILGEHQGDEVHLSEMTAEATRLQNLWFPAKPSHPLTIWYTADPSGKNRKDTGKSSIQTLRDGGRDPQVIDTANSAPARRRAIEEVARLMLQRTRQGECFGVHPRCEILIEGLAAGYVKDPKRIDGMPLKDGYYDNLQNCLEYLILAYAGLEEKPVDEQDPGWWKNQRFPGEPQESTQFQGGY